MIGSTVSRYRILAKIGGGGMGVVYEAEDLELGRRVAVKFLPEETARSTNALERFRREARAASTLNHPHICTIHDVGTHEGRPYLVMERLSGHTLRHAIGETGMPIERVIELGVQIADALDTAHRAGIVHRDIKPANLFLTERDQVKVLDFGLAKMVAAEASGSVSPDSPTVPGDALTEEGKTLGTVAYMSPEQAKGAAVDARSDLFSLGVVLYEMATGRLPFDAESAAEFFAAILTRQPIRPTQWKPGIPHRFEEIVLKALEKDPALRYQTVADLRADLLRLRRSSLDSSATLAGWGETGRESLSSAAAEPPPLAGRRPRRALWLGGAAILIAAAITLVAGGRWRRLVAPPAPPRNLSVLIGDTVNRTGDATFDDTLTELLTTSLNQSRALSVFPRMRAAFVLRLMQRDPATPIDESVGLEICQREGIGALVSASISPLGDTLLLLVRVLDPTGKELASARETFANPADAPARVDAIVRALRADIGESAASIRETSLPLAEVSSSSLEAVRFYTLGQRQQRGGKPKEALVMFQKALEIDPDFAMAHDMVGLVYTNLLDMARAEQHLERAVALSNRVAEAERHKILADYNLVHRNYGVACGHLQVLTELRSLDPVSYFALAHCKGFQLDFAGAVAMAQRGLAMQSYPLGRAILALYQLGNGQAADSLTTAQALLAEQPGNLQARFVAGRAELMLGRMEEARRSFEALVASGGEMETEGRLGLADLALGSGRPSAARRELEEAWSAAVRRGVALALGRAAANQAEMALADGRDADYELALTRFAGSTQPPTLYLAARSFARGRRAAEARASLHELEQATSDSPPDQALRAMARAELALADGDLPAAMREADTAWGFEPSVLARETQARAYDAAGRPAEAIRFYRDVVERKAQRLDSYDAPGFHRVHADELRLAALLVGAGDAEHARPLLEGLVATWKGAEDGWPPLAEARRLLAQLP